MVKGDLRVDFSAKLGVERGVLEELNQVQDVDLVLVLYVQQPKHKLVLLLIALVLYTQSIISYSMKA